MISAPAPVCPRNERCLIVSCSFYLCSSGDSDYCIGNLIGIIIWLGKSCLGSMRARLGLSLWFTTWMQLAHTLVSFHSHFIFPVQFHLPGLLMSKGNGFSAGDMRKVSYRIWHLESYCYLSFCKYMYAAAHVISYLSLF